MTSVSLFLEYLALLLSSVLDFVHGLFDGVICAGLWEGIWLAVFGIPVLSKKCLLFFCTSFIYVVCRVSGKVSGTRSTQRRAGIRGVMLPSRVNHLRVKSGQ